jgi:hypothetical protein
MMRPIRHLVASKLVRESLDKRGLSGGIEQKREPLAVNDL